MGLALEFEDGQTPLDDDEKEGLLIKSVSTRGELDEFEQLNIEQAMLWTMGRSFKTENLFTEEFIKALHKRMYGNVWAWSGEFRKTNKNIGVDKWQIPTDLKNLLDDAHYWVTNKVYSPEEIAIRFKHRLVSIHCFPNGNGRHSRFMADLLWYRVYKEDEPFSWGAANLVKQGDQRAAYLTAIRAADAGDIQPLIKFAKS